MTKKKDKESPENQELVNALESIRGLLEKSESKLSAARESLRKAKPPSNHIFRTTAAQSSEPVVPVLDEVIPLEDSDFVYDPDNLDVDLSDASVPELPLEEVALETEEEIPDLAEQAHGETEPTSTILQQPLDLPPPDAGLDEVELKVLLDDFKADLEKQLHETILQTMIQIEMDIKGAIETELDKLRDKLLKH